MTEVTDNAVCVFAANAMTSDMQRIEAAYVIESDLLDRAVHIAVAWETAKPKEPKSISIEYLSDGFMFKKFRMEFMHDFRDRVANEKYDKKDMKLGLMNHCGYSQLHNGVSQALRGTLGRHADVIILFLEGSNSYKEDDLSYQDSWGSW